MPTNVGSVRIDLGTLDFIEKNKAEAQRALITRVKADCEPFVPAREGRLRNSAWFPNGEYGNEIEYNVPYARYQYYGEVYGPNYPITKAGAITGWYSKGPNKQPMGRELGVPGTYKGWQFGYTTPGTSHHWFEQAKAQHLSEWEKLVRDVLTGGA